MEQAALALKEEIKLGVRERRGWRLAESRAKIQRGLTSHPAVLDSDIAYTNWR